MVIPHKLRCCRCRREFSSLAVMGLGERKVPMFVVIESVTSVEEALAQAVCQLCLDKGGAPERGLQEVLNGLRVLATSRVVIPARIAPVAQSPVDFRAVAARTRLRAPDPRPTLGALTRQEDPSQESLKGGIGESSVAVLEKARQALADSFHQKVGDARDLLQEIRQKAASADVCDLVEKFYALLDEALRLAAPNLDGQRKLLEYLGTSRAQLDELQLEVYLTHTVIPKKGDGGGGGCTTEVVPREARGCPRGKLERIKMDGITIVRKRSSLPLPNRPLGEPMLLVRVRYPDGEEYGSRYTVESGRPRSLPAALNTLGEALVCLVSWLAGRDDLIVACTSCDRRQTLQLNLTQLMFWRIESAALDESGQDAPEALTAVIDGRVHS